MSTGGTVFNWRAVKFFKDIGAERITFTRHLTLDEIGEIIPRMPPVETSVFILNSRCINVDGFCTFQHGLAGKKIFPMFRNACMLPYNVTVHAPTPELFNKSPMVEETMLQRQRIWEKVHVDDHPCGACAMFELMEMGITCVKIVGRGNPTERKARDVLFLKTLLDFLDSEAPSKNDFRKRAKHLYNETYKRDCRMHMCYFPEVMIDKDT
jgi:collagenase-like PrtC family protease